MTATFAYEPAENDLVDPQYVYTPNPRWSIQDCRSYGGGLVVVEHADESVSAENFWVRHYGEHSSLESAKAEIIERDRRSLAAAYVEIIGYDPFTDDPTINPETIRQTLAEFHEFTRE